MTSSADTPTKAPSIPSSVGLGTPIDRGQSATQSDLPPQSVIINNTNQKGGNNIAIQNNFGDQHIQESQKKCFINHLKDIKRDANLDFELTYGSSFGGGDPRCGEIYEAITRALSNDMQPQGDVGVGVGQWKLNILIVYYTHKTNPAETLVPPLGEALRLSFQEAQIPYKALIMWGLPSDQKEKIVVNLTAPPVEDHPVTK